MSCERTQPLKTTVDEGGALDDGAVGHVKDCPECLREILKPGVKGGPAKFALVPVVCALLAGLLIGGVLMRPKSPPPAGMNKDLKEYLTHIHADVEGIAQKSDRILALANSAGSISDPRSKLGRHAQMAVRCAELVRDVHSRRPVTEYRRNVTLRSNVDLRPESDGTKGPPIVSEEEGFLIGAVLGVEIKSLSQEDSQALYRMLYDPANVDEGSYDRISKVLLRTP